MTRALAAIPRGHETGADPMAGGASHTALPAITTLVLPTPPSVNQMFRNVRRKPGEKGAGRVATRVYIDWQGHAGWRLREQRPEPVHGPVLVVVNIERTSDLADVDNRIKATLDLLVKHGVIDDDRFVSGLAIAWSPPRDATMRVAIMPAAALPLQFQLAPDGRTGGWFFDAPQLEED